jgi:putative sterol carrier protein
LAIQILGGTTHRRGTPPAVVEMSPQTWLELLTRKLTWADALATGKIIASGERSDLSELF